MVSWVVLVRRCGDRSGDLSRITSENAKYLRRYDVNGTLPDANVNAMLVHSFKMKRPTSH